MPIVAVAGLGAVADAIVAIIVILAIVAVAYLISKFGSYIPYIGGWLAAQTTKFLAWTRDQLYSVYDKMAWGLTATVNATVTIITFFPQKVLDAAGVLYYTLSWIKFTLVPRALSAAYDFASAVAVAAYGYALALYNQAVDFTRTVELAAYGYALSLYSQAIGFAQAVLSAAYAYTATLYSATLAQISALEAAVGADLAALSTFVGAEVLAAEQYAAGLVTAAVQALEADIAATEARLTALIQSYVAAAEKDVLTLVDGAAVVALTDVWPGLVTDVDGILAEIPQELTDIRDLLATIPRAIPGDLASALSALGVLAIPLLRYLRECGVPMCKNLHGLSDLFNDLLTVETDLALLGLFTTAARSPRRAAALIMGTIAPVVREASAVTRDLIGV